MERTWACEACLDPSPVRRLHALPTHMSWANIQAAPHTQPPCGVHTPTPPLIHRQPRHHAATNGTHQCQPAALSAAPTPAPAVACSSGQPIGATSTVDLTSPTR